MSSGRLAVLDGVTNFPARKVKPIELRIADWVGDLDKTAQRKTQRYASVADGADRMLGRNARLSREQAISYAVLAVLASRLRELDQYAGRDTVLQHMHFGTNLAKR